MRIVIFRQGVEKETGMQPVVYWGEDAISIEEFLSYDKER